MTFPAIAIKVMIASPGDVSDERDAIREIIEEWNTVHAEERAQILLAIGWDSHSSPEMGDRPQAIINKQVLEKCDLLVAVFWTKLGTSTGKFPSGTVEEIEEQVNAGKTAMIYFSNAPVRFDKVERKQYDALLAFKQQCKAKGLYAEFENTVDFRKQFTRHLAQKIIDKYPSTKTEIEKPAQSARPVLSIEAKKLLLAASEPGAGRITRAKSRGGVTFYIGDKSMIPDSEPRTVASWVAAIGQLVELQALIENGSSYTVTDQGYRIGDAIRTAGLDELDQLIHRLDDRERTYLLTWSRPRNLDGANLSVFEVSTRRENVRYVEMLEKFYELDLMRFDGANYTMSTIGFQVCDRMWKIAILKCIAAKQVASLPVLTSTISQELQLTDGNAEADELQRYLKELAVDDLIRYATSGKIVNAKITPEGHAYLRRYTTLTLNTKAE